MSTDFAHRGRRQKLGKPAFAPRTGIGAGWIFLLLLVGTALLILGWKATRREGPRLQLLRPVKGVGQGTQLVIEARDSKHSVKSLRLDLIQAAHSLHHAEMTVRLTPQHSWKFWRSRPESAIVWPVTIGRSVAPDLKEGRATVRITALNDSWGRFFRGGKSQMSLDLPVRFVPPQVQVLTAQHYVNQGGCDMVLFKISDGTVESGVQAGNYFFPSCPTKDSTPDTRFCLFALPYNLDPKTPLRIVARDDAGNETLTSFGYKIFPKKFRSDTVKLTDDFLSRVVPPIFSQTPEIQDQGSPLKNFLLINSRLRELDSQRLASLSRNTSPQPRWKQPFIQLGNSKVEASFADHRAYVYGGQVVDHQDHVGFDLAATAHAPVVAANDGVVVLAGFFGIYGNAVVIDHGCGLQSLCGHLSSIGVKAGDSVSRGQVIGRSGQTGLAGGDHLHFAVVLDGVPVNPTEWWDPHWIHDRIESKLAPYR